MKGIIIKPIQSVNPQDSRGLTYEWCKELTTQQLTFCQRYKGNSSGNHYHTGIDPAKNPERVLVVQGQIRLRTCNGLETV